MCQGLELQFRSSDSVLWSIGLFFKGSGKGRDACSRGGKVLDGVSELWEQCIVRMIQKPHQEAFLIRLLIVDNITEDPHARLHYHGYPSDP